MDRPDALDPCQRTSGGDFQSLGQLIPWDDEDKPGQVQTRNRASTNLFPTRAPHTYVTQKKKRAKKRPPVNLP